MLTKTLSVLAVLLFATNTPTPDEGQWLPNQIRKMDWDKLKKRGMVLTKDEFWHPEKGGVLTAAVQINGCSASFVSKAGLVVTNHHCGFGAIQQLSSVKKNLVKDGFVANSREEELPARGMTVRIVRRIEDVTEKVKAALKDARSPIARYDAEQATMRKLISETQKQHKNTECSISSFFEGRQSFMYYRTLLTDVRLVYAPPKSVGEYGGEVDNWEWPRHTGDFCFFRAYAAPDGTPRGYNKENVPFEPQHILKVSKTGVSEGDLVLILGYPGRTERYLSSVAVADREAVYYPMRYDLLTKAMKQIDKCTKGNERKTLQYSSTRKSIANVQKNALGMVKGLARNAVVERKMREETQFNEWLKLEDSRAEKWGKVLDELKELDEEANKTTLHDLMITTMLRYPGGRIMPQFVVWHLLVDAAAAQPADSEDAPKYPKAMNRYARGNFGRDMLELQLPLFGSYLDDCRSLPEDQQIEGLAEFLKEKRPAAEILLDMMRKSPLRNAKGRQELLKGAPQSVTESDDPLIKLFLALGKASNAMDKRRKEQSGRRLVVGPQWIEAQQQWRGKSFYPDANSTMRVSIATVKGYNPRDGARYVPHTTVKGILDKHTGKAPFAAPKELVEAAKNRKKSRYFYDKVGDIPVCFLSDGDTTGGNSGSPVINGKGELVGLNFDRVFENVSGDYGWNADRSRNISVDIRYVLWFMEQVSPAHHLLEEMGVK